MKWIRAQSSVVTRLVGSTGMIALLAAGCAGGQPLPTQQVTDVEAATRGAKELGAAGNPQAQLHLKLADEQLKQAKVAMDDGDEQGAQRLLHRARVDAELAVALTKDSTAQSKAKEAISNENAARSKPGSSGGTL